MSNSFDNIDIDFKKWIDSDDYLDGLDSDNNEESKEDIAMSIMDILDNDEEVRNIFNNLLRKRKLDQLKKNG